MRSTFGAACTAAMAAACTGMAPLPFTIMFRKCGGRFFSSIAVFTCIPWISAVRKAEAMELHHHN